MWKNYDSRYIFLVFVSNPSTDIITESAAEALKRPLYYISGAEIGLLDNHYNSYSTSTTSIEGKLDLIFKRIARWEAILLFDEADTFVASRGVQDHDGKRNALTSSMSIDLLYGYWLMLTQDLVLLRMIEYQSGIIFLTTNRITDFDTALFSRVHITLRFEPLLPSQRQFVWENMAKQTDHNFTDSDFERLSQVPLDGRSIKNILRVASLHTKMRERKTKSSGVKMDISDVEAVLRFAVGDPGNEDIGNKVEEFYKKPSIRGEF